jgi:hypothetical protein
VIGSFVKRLLRASLVLPQGTFPGTNSNTLVLERLRMSATIEGAGNFTNSCSLQVYGMRQVDMNAVTVLYGQDGNPQNINARALLTLEASEENGSFFTVFQGQFQEASPDYRSVPDAVLKIQAMQGYGAQISTATPQSFSGGVEVEALCARLAKQMGFAFENNGVTGQLNTPYLSGTLMDQFREVCQAAGCDYYFDPNNVIIICPRNQGRQNRPPVVISPTSGLVGYVTLERFGVSIDALWTPAFSLGSPLRVKDSDVPGTNGDWFPFAFTHDLDSLKPGGRWFSHLKCSPHSERAS